MASPNKPTPAPCKFDKSFKAEALRMLDEGQSTAARSLNMGEKQPHTWEYFQKKQTQKQLVNNELMAENDRLKAQLKQAGMERDILKKSLAIFIQPT